MFPLDSIISISPLRGQGPSVNEKWNCFSDAIGARGMEMVVGMARGMGMVIAMEMVKWWR